MSKDKALIRIHDEKFSQKYTYLVSLLSSGNNFTAHMAFMLGIKSAFTSLGQDMPLEVQRKLESLEGNMPALKRANGPDELSSEISTGLEEVLTALVVLVLEGASQGQIEHKNIGSDLVNLLFSEDDTELGQEEFDELMIELEKVNVKEVVLA